MTTKKFPSETPENTSILDEKDLKNKITQAIESGNNELPNQLTQFTQPLHAMKIPKTDPSFPTSAQRKYEDENWESMNHFNFGNLETNIEAEGQLKIQLIRQGVQFAVLSSIITGEFAFFFKNKNAEKICLSYSLKPHEKITLTDTNDNSKPQIADNDEFHKEALSSDSEEKTKHLSYDQLSQKFLCDKYNFRQLLTHIKKKFKIGFGAIGNKTIGAPKLANLLNHSDHNWVTRYEIETLWNFWKELEHLYDETLEKK